MGWTRYTLTMHGALKNPIAGLVLALLCLSTSAARAQVEGVLLEVHREHLGLAGQSQLGAWTPVRLTLENQSSQPRQVLCRWLLSDADGDRVTAQRRVTLDALGTHDAWVYGPLPIHTRPNDPWVLQVLTDDATVEITRTESHPVNIHPRDVRLIGVAGGHDMGLNAYTYQATLHEPVELVTGLSLTTLPDRWYGLSAIDTLVWSSAGGDPDDPLVSSNTQQALRQWIRRGGHLVIVLPAFGESWSGSGLSDLLPVKTDKMYRFEDQPPTWLGDVRGEAAGTAEPAAIDITTFQIRPGDGVDVIQTHEGRPVIVAKRIGAGRVTLVGIDLADQRFSEMGLPNGKYPIWNDIFMWQAPVYTKARIDADIDTAKMSRPSNRGIIPLGRFIPGRTSMRGTAATALLAAILIFGLYWVTAGPASFFVLKNKNATRHSWVVFLAIVVLFSGISWAGAWLIAPSSSAISHFTLLDAQAGNPNVHAHSWLSVYLPTFANQTIQVDPDQPNARNTLASPGMATNASDTGFVDPQTYAIDAGNPAAADIPFRSTAKHLEIDFLGRIDKTKAGLPNPIILPQGKALQIQHSLPTGELSHGLPGTLNNVRILYCPGGNKTPLIWQVANWEPNEILKIGELTNGVPLVQRPTTYDKRNFKAEGFLGMVMDSKPGQKLIDATGNEVTVTVSDTVQYIQLLSFFDTLPPPDFCKTSFPYANVYDRSIGRQLDITRLLSGHRLIVLGHLEDSPMPIPITADGNDIPSSGWTVVRWVYDFN